MDLSQPKTLTKAGYMNMLHACGVYFPASCNGMGPDDLPLHPTHPIIRMKPTPLDEARAQRLNEADFAELESRITLWHSLSDIEQMPKA